MTRESPERVQRESRESLERAQKKSRKSLEKVQKKSRMGLEKSRENRVYMLREIVRKAGSWKKASSIAFILKETLIILK